MARTPLEAANDLLPPPGDIFATRDTMDDTMVGVTPPKAKAPTRGAAAAAVPVQPERPTFEALLQHVRSISEPLYWNVVRAHDRAKIDEAEAAAFPSGSPGYTPTFRPDQRFIEPEADPYFNPAASPSVVASDPTSHALNRIRELYPQEYERIVRGTHMGAGTARSVHQRYAQRN